MRGIRKITQERLKELVHYDPETGIFTRKTQYGKKKIGDVTGNLDKDGYLSLSLEGNLYRAHRMAWWRY